MCLFGEWETYPAKRRLPYRQKFLDDYGKHLYDQMYQRNNYSHELFPCNIPMNFSDYVDDGYCRRKKGGHDVILDALNGFHPRLKFTDEVEPDHFLDSEICTNDESRTVPLKVFHKENKFPVHRLSQTPHRYKRNAILCELHRVSVISDDFQGAMVRIRERYLHDGYPNGFTNETFKNSKFERFQRIIPQDRKPILRIRLPFCKQNENLSRVLRNCIRS